MHLNWRRCRSCDYIYKCVTLVTILVLSLCKTECRQECVLDEDCSKNLACIDSECRDSCVGACGKNALCEIYKTVPVCACPDGYTGNPFTFCYCPTGFTGNPFFGCNPIHTNKIKGEELSEELPVLDDVPCTLSSECSVDLACINELCKDPCPGSCGFNASCTVVEHTPVCSCETGFTGNPFSGCNPIHKSKSRNITTTPTTTTTTSTTTSNTPTTTTTTHRPPIISDYCEIPSNDQNLIVTDLAQNLLTPGMFVSPNTVVKFKCRTKYTLEGEPTTFCAESGWEKNVPKCIKYCPRSDLTKKISSSAECYYNDVRVSCNDRIRPGTRARLSCETGFVPPPSDRGIRKYEYLHCRNEGSWDNQPHSCNMECGHVPEKTQEFSLGGNKVNITDVPWHVGIYFLRTIASTSLGVPDTVSYIHICGGTIITPSLVISAAHCFWDKANQKIQSEKLFSVAAGKYFRDYDSNEEFFRVIKRNVSAIYVPSNYLGADENYRADVAVIKLSVHLKFGQSIRPVCIEFETESAKEVENDWNGIFAGWGINEAERASEVLQSVSMQTLPYGECRRRIRTKFPNYKLPTDKFCLYDAYGATACRGDSGGGFVISVKTKQNEEYFKLLGVVSHGASKSDCAENFVIMTNVQWFSDLIEYHKKESEHEF